MKRDNPKRYRVEGEAEWGIAEGLIFENWEEKEFDHREISKRKGVVLFTRSSVHCAERQTATSI